MKNSKVRNMVGIAIMMAIVVILQMLGSFVKIGPAVFSLVLVPIVVGAAMYGPNAGAILGLTFSIVVLLDPNTAMFYGWNFFGTVITVLVKGTAAGYLAGLTYSKLANKNRTFAVMLAAAVCPIVNTGIFSLGCRLFFWQMLAQMGDGNALYILLAVFIGINFVGEFLVNVICGPVILRILDAVKK